MALTFTEKAKQLGATSFFPCPQWVSFRIDNCKILFEPNVYNGTGDETRVNICFKSDELVQKVLEFEKQLSGSVSSAVKNEMEHVKSKLAWDKVKFYDLTTEATTKPNKLAGYICNAVFVIKGKWVSHGQVGLSIETTDIQLIEAQDNERPNPFLLP